MTVPEVLIVADDLTGAADSGVAFAERGRATAVSLNGSIPDASVVAVDTDTRRAAPGEAAAAVYAAVAAGREAGVLTFYKKVDSTLRGNVGPELAAFVAAAGPGLCVFSPSFPATGRTTLDGVLLVGGVPLERTQMWRLARRPAPTDIGTLLTASGLRAALVGLDTVRRGPAELAPRLAALHRDGAQVAVCDAETDDDLAAIVSAGLRLPDPVVWAGSGGLATSLAAQLPAGPVNPPQTAGRGRVLAIVGSASEAAAAQAADLAAAGFTRVAVDAGQLLDDDGDALRATAARVGAALGHSDTLVTLAHGEVIGARDAGQRVAATLGQLLAPATRAADTLVLTGGETARAVLTAAGATGFRLVGQLGAGVVHARAQAQARHWNLITKAGAFGDPAALVGALNALDASTGVEGSLSRHPRPGHHAPRGEPSMSRPIIALTMGDPAGVGPEIIVKALAHPEVQQLCRTLVVGDADRLEQARHITKTDIEIIRRTDADRATYAPGTLECLDLNLLPKDLQFGRLSPIAGDAAYRYIACAVELALAHRVDAICTAPLNKEALHAGGHLYPGHTEMLAELTGTPEVSMMLSTAKVRVIHVTTHIGLIDAIEKIDAGLVYRTIDRGAGALRAAGIPDPAIAVCGINPHAGENGLFGRGEEEEKIAPAIAKARAAGIDARGPLPADTVFFRAGRGDFDLVVAMYHDQGHGPVKILGLEAGVNITVGLPVIRTSVDHGTAFDIAGTGQADERSLIEALRQATELAPHTH